MGSTTLKSGFVLLSFLFVCPSGRAIPKKPDKPTCEVLLDLRYELQQTARVTLAGQMEVPPPAVQLIMGKAGEADWDELTRQGKKYPSICRDDEHPYYVLVWKVTDYDATAELEVLDDGCLVYPSVYSTVSIGNNRDKAIKKVFKDTLRFLAENGKQAAPTPLTCVPPEMLGPLGPTKYKLKPLKDICRERRPTYTKACSSLREKDAVPPEVGQPPPGEPERGEGASTVGTGFFVSEHGYILTNAHVVSSCRQIQTREGRAASLVSKMCRSIWPC